MIKLSPFIAIISLLFSVQLSAQQLPQYTQYMFNTISVNPAYAGSRGTLNATLLHRNQWSGLNGNPVTSTFSVHTPLKNERIGLGISYISDQLGFEKTNYVYGDFAYTIPVSEGTRLSFGLKAGFTNYQLENPDQSDPFFNANFNSWNPNFGAGLYLTSDSWYVGISSPRILNTDLNEGEFEALERNSYYGIAGLVFDLAPEVKFRPTALIKVTDSAPLSYDFTASVFLYEKLWMGVSFRLNDTSNFGAYLDYQFIKNLRLGYAYDLPTSTIRPYTGGTHEIILIYEPNFFAKKKLFKSPRYF